MWSIYGEDEFKAEREREVKVSRSSPERRVLSRVKRRSRGKNITSDVGKIRLAVYI